MIYLIDDKKNRQEFDCGWTENKLKAFKASVYPIYFLEDLVAKSDEIFEEGNVVLYHESFLDYTSLKQEAAEKREKLELFAKENRNFILVIFSGSKNSRTLEKNVAHIPVSVLYQNLELFTQYSTNGNADLKYLLFGENPQIEAELNLKLESANSEIENVNTEISSGNSLFIRPNTKYIQNVNVGEEQVVFNDVSDEKFSQKIIDWLSVVEYDNIFIPLCFGPVLSDYNGLRLATHIRCTSTLNQLKNIYIYGFVGMYYLLDNKYFNILKTRNVSLIEYKKSVFQSKLKLKQDDLLINELPIEIDKLKLQPPKNYEDNHSIANEWAIFRWASVIGAKDEEIEAIIEKIENKLYFKYLRTLYPNSDFGTISEEGLKLTYNKPPKVLLVDDEADKGWYEVLCAILHDKNEITLNPLENIKSKTQDEIINLALDEIKIKDIEIVILDFRLHPDDFDNPNIEEITGLMLLKKIKKHNPGIQVLVFSATNKIWNLQALQAAGADGFIIKESPENSSDANYTVNVIESFIDLMKVAISKTYLRKLYKDIKELKSLSKEWSDRFNNSAQERLDIAFDLLKGGMLHESEETRKNKCLFEKFDEKYDRFAFLMLYQIIEDFIEFGEFFSINRNSVSIKLDVNNWFDIVPKHKVLNKVVYNKGDGKFVFSDQTENEESRDLNSRSTYFLASSLLIFRYGFNDSFAEFPNTNLKALNLKKINNNRNNKIGHGGKSKGRITLVDVEQLLDFLLYVLNPNNVNPKDFSIYKKIKPKKKIKMSSADKLAIKKAKESFKKSSGN